MIIKGKRIYATRSRNKQFLSTREVLQSNDGKEFTYIDGMLVKKMCPDLTLGELRLCALIKLNMNTKDIASINNITINGVKVARYRLRKKLGLNDASDNLSDFLANY